MSVDWAGISERVRGLVRMEEYGVEVASAKLGLQPDVIHAGVNGVSRSATLRVVEAVVRVYGLDPTWIITGQYDSATHRTAMQAKPAELMVILKRLVSQAARDPEPRVE
jgi:hypothetical protein